MTISVCVIAAVSPDTYWAQQFNHTAWESRGFPKVNLHVRLILFLGWFRGQMTLEPSRLCEYASELITESLLFWQNSGDIFIHMQESRCYLQFRFNWKDFCGVTKWPVIVKVSAWKTTLMGELHCGSDVVFEKQINLNLICPHMWNHTFSVGGMGC